jgi:hypothetical protein
MPFTAKLSACVQLSVNITFSASAPKNSAHFIRELKTACAVSIESLCPALPGFAP